MVVELVGPAQRVLPEGGPTGYLLAKASPVTDDTEWVPPPAPAIDPDPGAEPGPVLEVSDVGRALVGAEDAETARDVIGAGTSDLTLGTGAGEAAPGNAVVRLSGGQTVGGVKTFAEAPVVPAAAFPVAAVAGLTAALAGKAPAFVVIGAEDPLPDPLPADGTVVLRRRP